MRVIGQVPIHRALCDGWDEQLLVSHKAVAVAVVFAVACSLDPNPKNVISTEAAHAFVSSAVEKSASLPKQHPSHCRVFAVALAFVSALFLPL